MLPVQQLNSIKVEPRLLIANFEINNETYPIVVDTGASISCLPGRGSIMKRFNFGKRPANLNVQMANNVIVHINEKVLIPIKPTGANCEPIETNFYVAKGESHIVGYEALIGLPQLKLFDLEIEFRDGQVQVYHEGRSIGQECESLRHIKSAVKVDNRFDSLDLDEQLTGLLKKYKSIFADIDKDPIYGNAMRIYTTHNRPIFSKQRHYGPDEISQMKSHIKNLLDRGIIEPTNSGYSATSRIIPKKSGAGRLVVNYIPLNAVTLRDSYVLPHVTDILGVLEGKQYFTTMDCSQGFYQVLVDARDRHKTAFSTPMGSFQFIRCPFGARNSCATFQAEMNRIFSEGLFTRCVVYVDDILVFGSTREEHDDNLAWVFSKCAKFNVKLKLEKCHFARTEVDYLGFRISGNSIKPLASRVDTLCKSEPPKDKTSLRSIIGKLNFYSRFIPDYSSKLEPLRELFKNNRDFQWKPRHQQVYENLLESLKRAPQQTLANPLTNKFIELHVMRDSLEVICVDENEQLVCRTSRFLSASEVNYSLIEKQLLALVLAIKRFRTFLHPEHFIVRVPTKDLERTLMLINRPDRVENLLLRMPAGFDSFKFVVKESLSADKSARKIITHLPEEIYYIDGACKANGKEECQATWAVCAEYDEQLELVGYVTNSPSNQSAELTAAIKACELAKERGQKAITIITDSKYLHSAATNWIDKWQSNDWLDNKRKPVINTDLFKQLLFVKNGLEIEWLHVKGHADCLGNIRADSLARSLLDEKCARICALSTTSNPLQTDNEEIEVIKDDIQRGLRRDLIIGDDETVYYIDPRIEMGDPRRIYVPKSSRSYLLDLAHDNPLYGGHLGIKKTHGKLFKFWWPRMLRDIELYVKSCDICQRFKQPTGPAPGYLNNIPVSKIFEHVHIDIVGPVKRTNRGNAYIMTATDAFSKWAFASTCQNIRTQEVIRFLEDSIIALHGKPHTIISDRGSQFTSKEWQDYMSKMNIRHNLTTPYHPQSNGVDERLNGTLVRILRAYVDEYQDDWDIHLKWALFVYNTTCHNSTGYSPYQLLHGLTSRSPFNANLIEIDDHEEINRIRNCIREEASQANKRAQAAQKSLYDRTHSVSKLEIGQLVLAREHVAPNDLSRKFYPKWYGPCVVIGFVGDQKAIKIFDCSRKTKKIVAVRDVKPYLEPGSWLRGEKDHLQEEKGDEAILQSDTQLSAGDFISLGDEHENILAPKAPYSLDLSELTGPISSSPKRVTINQEVETLFYDPSFYYEADQIEGPSENSTNEPGSEDVGTSQVPGGVLPCDLRHNCQSDQQLETPPTNPKYVMDFIIDDSIDDPHYEPSSSTTGPTDATICPRPDHTSSAIPETDDTAPRPRYNLRPRRYTTNNTAPVRSATQPTSNINPSKQSDEDLSIDKSEMEGDVSSKDLTNEDTLINI